MSAITSQQILALYNDAKLYAEWATTRLWEYFMNKKYFPAPQWAISSQQPPTLDLSDLRRVDLVVEHFKDNGASETTLIIEAKRHSATNRDIDTVEYQAFAAACAHCTSNGKSAVWAMTCVGPSARVWVYSVNADYLIPYLPGSQGLAERNEYLDLGTSGVDLQKAMDFIAKHRTPPTYLLRNNPSPRPQNATLPQGWHAEEVIALDKHRASSPSWAASPSGQASSPSWLGPDRILAPYGSGSIPLHPDHWVEVRILSRSRTTFLCERAQDSSTVTLPQKRWSRQMRELEGEQVECSVYIGTSQTVYYTWDLRPLN